MPVKPYTITDIKQKQPAVVQSLKGGDNPFSARTVSALQASEAQKAGEWRLAVWCEDMVLARKRAKDLNARACIGERKQPELPKKDTGKVQQMTDTKVETPGAAKTKKFTVKSGLRVKAAVEDPTAKPRGIERGAAAMSGWMAAGGKEIAGADEPENNIVDLFTDLLHYAESKGLDGANAMRVAQGHFAAETEGGELEGARRLKATRRKNIMGTKEVYETEAGGGLDLYCSLSGCGKDLTDGDIAYSMHPFNDAEDDGYPHYCSQEHLNAAVKNGSEARMREAEEEDPHARSESGEDDPWDGRNAGQQVEWEREQAAKKKVKGAKKANDKSRNYGDWSEKRKRAVLLEELVVLLENVQAETNKEQTWRDETLEKVYEAQKDPNKFSLAELEAWDTKAQALMDRRGTGYEDDEGVKGAKKPNPARARALREDTGDGLEGEDYPRRRSGLRPSPGMSVEDKKRSAEISKNEKWVRKNFAPQGSKKPSQAQVRHAILALKGKTAMKADRMGGFGETYLTPETKDKVKAEMARILKKLGQYVQRHGMHESLGQKEIRKFGDDCRAGKFGTMEWHQAGKFEEDLRSWVESINP